MFTRCRSYLLVAFGIAVSGMLSVSPALAQHHETPAHAAGHDPIDPAYAPCHDGAEHSHAACHDGTDHSHAADHAEADPPHEAGRQGVGPMAGANPGDGMPLYEVLGDFSRPITTSSDSAQAYFDQGMRLRYGFANHDAARSFREAQRHDPNCAMCYWGEAWALGRFLNGGIGIPFAYASIRRAMELAEDHADPVEQALIAAASTRYVEDVTSVRPAVLDTAYAEAMQLVYETYPDDLDVGTLYGEALFLLEPRRGTRDINSPAVQRIHRVFEGVMEVDLRHPGACHLYIHATESTSRPEKAEACAEHLGDVIPGVSHVNHMPAHTFSQIGRWGDAVRVSIQARETDRRAERGEAFAVYPSHNLHMLVIAAAMDGQGAVSVEAAEDYARMTGGTMYQLLALVRFGRFDEILQLRDRPRDPIGTGVWEFAQGYARLRTGGVDSARAHLASLLEVSSPGMFRFHPVERLLGIVGGILEGEIHREDGNLDAAVASFTRAVSLQDALTWDEPEPLPFAARHWLGAVLLDAARFEEAEEVYRESLVKHPRNGWSLFGLIQAVEAQGKPIDEVREAFEASWARSDTPLTASRF